MKPNGNGKARESLVRKVVIRDEDGHLVEVKNLTLYADLLTAMHQSGIKALQTSVVQLPLPDNGQLAVVKAVLKTGIGVFTGLGDASPQSVEAELVPHLIRVAETRAKARALRDALGVGVVAVEELTDGATLEALTKSEAAKEQPQQSASADPSKEFVPMTDKQRQMLFRQLAKRGIEGETAKQHLLTAFGVSDLRNVSRKAASGYIDKLMKENGDGRQTEANHAA